MRIDAVVFVPALMLASLALFPAPGAVEAQEGPRTRAESVLPAPVFAQVVAAAEAAEAEGIPGDILFNKALEGAAKRVPAERLVPGVLAYGRRLQQAQAAFGRDAAGPLLVAGADALQRGVPSHLLRGLGQGPERSPVAVLVLADLVETDLDEDEALGLVREAVRLRAREGQMLDMPGQVRTLLRQGRAPGDVVEQVRRMLQRGRGGGMTSPVAPGAEPSGRGGPRRGGGGG